MRFFLGLLVGLMAAVAIAVAAGHIAFGDIKSLALRGDRAKAEDVTRTFELADFDRLDIGGVFELDVTVGGDYSVTLSGPADEIERVTAEVADGGLVLARRDSHRIIRLGKNQSVSARIVMPSLRAMDISGVVSGAVRDLKSEELSVAISGVGNVNLNGTCGSLRAAVSGVGDLEARDLQCRKVKVTVSGVGSADVYASEEISATISGMGAIDVYGSPATVETSGGMFAKISVH